MKQTLFIIFGLLIIFIIGYTLHHEGIITITDWDNLLSNLIETVKTKWNELTTPSTN
jgi:hypothetical protein